MFGYLLCITHYKRWISFICSVGCTYFKNIHLPFSQHTQHQCLCSIRCQKTTLSLYTLHGYIELLEERIWSKLKCEEEMIPSDEALRRHWKRACLVLSIYEHCTQNNIKYLPLIGNGWNLSNSNLTIDWDSEENMINIRQTVALMRKGCGCKTSFQSSCKCKRAGNYCYGCKCVGCCNLPSPTPGQVTDSALSTPLESGSEEERDNESYKDLKMLMQRCWKFLVTLTFKVSVKSVTMTL